MIDWRKVATSMLCCGNAVLVSWVAQQHGNDWKIYAASLLMGIGGVIYGHVY
jgi:uncharacterized membrane protein YjjB (DUF3815 family)